MNQPKQNKTQSKLLKISLGLFILIGIIAIASDDDASDSKGTITEITIEGKSKAKQKKIESQFSAWDGSHRNLEKLIKENLNDPDSYEHLKTNYWDMDSLIVVRTEYTAKNGFGGRVQGAVKARFDLEGNLIEVIDSQ